MADGPWHPFSLWILVANSSAIWAVVMKPAILLLCTQPGMGWMLRGLSVCCLLPYASTLLETWVVLPVFPPRARLSLSSCGFSHLDL